MSFADIVRSLLQRVERRTSASALPAASAVEGPATLDADRFVWQFEPDGVSLTGASADSLPWSERIRICNDRGAQRRCFALCPGDLLASPELRLPPEPSARFALIALAPADRMEHVMVTLLARRESAQTALVGVSGQALRADVAFVLEVPLPPGAPMQLALSVETASGEPGTGEATPVVGLCEWLVGGTGELSRLRGLADYAWRLENERRHFEAVYRDSFFRPQSATAPTSSVQPMQAPSLTDAALAARQAAARRALARRAGQVAVEAGEDAYRYSHRLLGLLIDQEAPNHIARAGELAASKVAQPLRILSIMCGSARVEQQMLEFCKTPIELILVDANEQLLTEAISRMPAGHRVSGYVADINSGLPDLREVDIVMCVAALHHVVEVERLLRQINEMLGENGEFWSIGEYVGRNGSVLWPDEYAIANALFAGLPERLRINKVTGKADAALPNIDCSHGSFEGVRSQELLELLHRHLTPQTVYLRNCFLWRLVDPAYAANYDLENEADLQFVRQAAVEDALCWQCGGRPVELHAIYRKRGFTVKTGEAQAIARSERPGAGGVIEFTCNVCGAANAMPPESVSREEGCCRDCASTVRMRAMVHLLSLSLYGDSRPLARFARDKAIRGIGLSDWDEYARRLERLFDYRNTYYHREPRVDITDPPAHLLGALDFLISSDVFEHVAPPVDRAFAGAAAVLKPGGWMIFSVPYGLQPETEEHFPHLYDFRIEQRDGVWTLINTRRDGTVEEFRDLIFHGGPGQTLEMRRFCLDHLRRLAAQSGFDRLEVLDEPVWQFGIHDDRPWGRPMRLRKAK